MPGKDVCVAVVVPTYNERENVVKLISRLERVLGEMGVCRRYIVVDDNSPDGTAEAVRGLQREIPWIKVVVRPGKLGIGSAILRGIKEALAMREVTHIVTMDADLSHRPEDLPALLGKAGEAGLVQGSRYVTGGGVENWGLHRRLISWAANWLVERLYHVGVREHTTNYRVYSRDAAEAVARYAGSSGYEFVIEALLIIHALGYRIVEVPIRFINRRTGKSKLGVSSIIKWFIYIIRFRRRFRELREMGR